MPRIPQLVKLSVVTFVVICLYSFSILPKVNSFLVHGDNAWKFYFSGTDIDVDSETVTCNFFTCCSQVDDKSYYWLSPQIIRLAFVSFFLISGPFWFLYLWKIIKFTEASDRKRYQTRLQEEAQERKAHLPGRWVDVYNQLVKKTNIAESQLLMSRLLEREKKYSVIYPMLTISGAHLLSQVSGLSVLSFDAFIDPNLQLWERRGDEEWIS